MGKKHNRNQEVLDRGKWFHYKNTILLLAAGVIMISGITIWNAANLQNAIDKRTQQYVSDVSLQLTEDIDYRLSKNKLDLESLRESFLQVYEAVGEQGAEALLNQKAPMLGFTSLAVLNTKGKIYCSSPIQKDIFETDGIQASFHGGSGISFLNEQSILYSVPVFRDGEVVGVLAGVRDKKNMQELIQPRSFSGRGLTCIINADGEVVISPTDVELFLQLDDVFEKKSDSEVLRNIQKMQNNIANWESGLFTFTAVDGKKLVLSYNPLNNYDWILLTLVPADLISHETDLYITRSFLAIAVIILLFGAIFAAFFRAYRVHYKEIERVAFVDSVTGSMNNAAFQLKCQKLLQNEKERTYAVALLNIKNFKLINENFGSAEGDRTLQYIMRVLERNITKDELAARADADNFFLCIKGNQPEAIRERLKNLIAEINSFNRVLDAPYYLILQPGVYIVDDPNLEITVVQDRAKTACRNRTAYEDEKCIFYDAAFTQQMQREHELNDLFENSLKGHDFQVYFQPKILLDSQNIGGAEALVRWEHPRCGMIFPSDFIPLFEKNGKICKLDLYVFEEVCKTILRWKEEGRRLFPISVNLSRQHFKREDCLKQFEEIAARYQVPKELIELELTESIFFDDQGIEYVKKQIDEMHRSGFQCSLDDFGAGYSSLGLLMEFDVDVIKLDRRFFLNVSREKTKDVVESVVNLAKKIGVRTVAEGIEDAEQLALLRTVHCDMVQGYIFSKPLPIPSFEQWLEEINADKK